MYAKALQGIRVRGHMRRSWAWPLCEAGAYLQHHHHHHHHHHQHRHHHHTLFGILQNGRNISKTFEQDGKCCNPTAGHDNHICSE